MSQGAYPSQEAAHLPKMEGETSTLGTPCHPTAPNRRHLQQLAFVLQGHTPHLEHLFHAVTGADQHAPGTPHRASDCLVPCDLV